VANFTFADSKIGSMMLAQREREQHVPQVSFIQVCLTAGASAELVNK